MEQVEGHEPAGGALTQNGAVRQDFMTQLAVYGRSGAHMHTTNDA